MSLKLYIRTFFILVFLFTSGLVVSCRDEDLGNDFDVSFPEEEEYAIAFTLSLPAQENGTRAYGSFNNYEDYENYIDTKDMLRVFFFDEWGRFLFGAIDRTVTPLPNTDKTYNWYVRVPINYIVDRDGNSFDVNIIREYLRNHSFKIAVLANWPNKDVEIKTEDSYDDEGNKIEGGVIQVKDEPLWGYNESILNPNSKNVKNINDLHHLVEDGKYNDDATTYGFAMQDGKMGQLTDWVKMRDMPDGLSGSFSSKETAETWIKENLNPDGSVKLHHYDRLWQEWNFGGNASDNYIKYDSFATEWENRNGQNLRNWLQDNWKALTSDNTIDNLFFKATTKSNSYARIIYVDRYNKYYGIQMPPAEDLGTENYINVNNPSRTPKGYLRFNAPATGQLRIRYGSSDGSRVYLKVQLASDIAKEDNTNSTFREKIWDLSIDDEDKDVFLFFYSDPNDASKKSGNGVIYEIEWVCRKYLYDTNREAIEPSSQNPIPMYGVQDFPALGTYWDEGSTIELSNDYPELSYKGKSINLIRALAKIEVYIDKKLGNLSHIYMRSMNRTSRCEPMDVETPINIDTWNFSHTNGTCEFFDIQNYGPTYNSTRTNNYSSFLSWFYGSWANAKWYVTTRTDDNGNINLTNSKGWDFPYEMPLKVGGLSYPHIFNPHINRSDFCRFIGTPIEAGDYMKYVMYMPEKIIDDPNTVGDMTSIPKVAHIEYRFDNNSPYHNTDSNLDDDDCYRLYFTDYNNSSAAIHQVTQKDGYKEYEQNNANLKEQFPILRNHVYQFFVGGSGIANPEVRINISDWGYEKYVFEW